MFTVIPAIDLRAGSVVRLTKGEIGTETTYYKQPVEALKHWMALGARTIHVVDLDAAAGIGNNQATVKDLVDAAGSKAEIQVGGGVRSVDVADGYLAMGVHRVVVSTAAVKKEQLIAMGQDESTGVYLHRCTGILSIWINQALPG